jgi:hypothetical protein
MLLHRNTQRVASYAASLAEQSMLARHTGMHHTRPFNAYYALYHLLEFHVQNSICDIRPLTDVHIVSGVGGLALVSSARTAIVYGESHCLERSLGTPIWRGILRIYSVLGATYDAAQLLASVSFFIHRSHVMPLKYAKTTTNM